jgi:hypothetical protein
VIIQGVAMRASPLTQTFCAQAGTGNRVRWAIVHGVMAAFASLILVRPALADVESDYGRGWTAYKQGNWKLVVQSMNAAIEQRPVEQGRVNIGSNNNQPYLPHYYLGLAKFRLGDCRGALDSWQKSLEQGYVRKFRQENEEFSKFYPICEKDVEVEMELATARTLLTKLDVLSKDAHLSKVWSTERALGPEVARMNTFFENARAELTSARNEREQQRLSALVSAKSTAGSVRRALETLEMNARTRQEALAAESRPAPSMGTVGGLPAAVGGSVSKPHLSATDVAGAKGPASTSSPGVGTAKVELPPDRLRSGIKRFVSGRYREAFNTLSEIQSGRWQGHAALFRSAASFSLYRSTGDAQWHARALAAARECAELSPTIQMDNEMLSPAFRKFFAEALAARSSAQNR